MMNVAFTPENKAAALEIVVRHFVPAVREAGIEDARFLINDSGDWHLTCMLPVARGPSYSRRDIAPEPVNFWHALVARERTPAKAAALFERYLSMIEREEHRLVREPELPGEWNPPGTVRPGEDS